MRRFFNDVRAKLRERNQQKQWRSDFEEFQRQVELLDKPREKFRPSISRADRAKRKKARKVSSKSRRRNRS